MKKVLVLKGVRARVKASNMKNLAFLEGLKFISPSILIFQG